MCGRRYSSTRGVPLPLETKPVTRPCCARLLEDRDRPLGGDQRLVVGGDDDARALPQRVLRRATPASCRAAARPRADRAAPATSPSSGSSCSADRSRACRSCRRARRDRRGRTASSRSGRTARRRRSPTARAAAVLVEADLADAHRALGNRALVAARMAAQTRLARRSIPDAKARPATRPARVPPRSCAKPGRLAGSAFFNATVLAQSREPKAQSL